MTVLTGYDTPLFFFTVSPVSGQQGGSAAHSPRAVPLPPAVPVAGIHFLPMRIRMEHSVINRHWRPSSTGAPAGREQARRRSVNELVELIGLPATLELIRAKGGTALRVPLGMTPAGGRSCVKNSGADRRTRAGDPAHRTLRGERRSMSLPAVRPSVDTRDEKINRGAR